MRKPNKRLTEPDWRRVKKRVCAGESVCIVAGEFGITPATVWRRKKMNGWVVSEAPKCKLVALTQDPKEDLPGKVNPPDNSRPHGMLAEQDPNNQQLTILARDLLEAAQTAPDRFDQTAGAFAQAMVAAGMAQIPPPRTVGELVKWEGLRRQFLALDVKTSVGGLFDPVRPFRRATGVTVEADPAGPDPLEGFEV